MMSAAQILDRRAGIAEDIQRERARQDELKAAGKFRWTCADTAMLDSERLAVLMEEVGEVAREVTEAIGKTLGEQTVEASARKRIREELVQVAAVCVAWIEGLANEDREAEAEAAESI